MSFRTQSLSPKTRMRKSPITKKKKRRSRHQPWKRIDRMRSASDHKLWIEVWCFSTEPMQHRPTSYRFTLLLFLLSETSSTSFAKLPLSNLLSCCQLTSYYHRCFIVFCILYLDLSTNLQREQRLCRLQYRQFKQLKITRNNNALIEWCLVCTFALCACLLSMHHVPNCSCETKFHWFYERDRGLNIGRLTLSGSATWRSHMAATQPGN